MGFQGRTGIGFLLVLGLVACGDGSREDVVEGRLQEDQTLSATGRITPVANGVLPPFDAQTLVGDYGTFVLTSEGNWRYDLDNASDAVQGLGAGETVTESFTVESNNGEVSTVTLAIDGTDDPPEISSGTGSVTEDGALDTGGVLTASDIDNPVLAFVAQTVQGAYGSLTLSTDGTWNYVLDNASLAVQALVEGEVYTDVLTVNLDDGSTTTVTIAVTGGYDAPGDLSGSVDYQDRLYSNTGFTGVEQPKPVRHAIIDLVDGDGTIAATTETTDLGGYVFTGIPIGEYTLRVVAKTPDSSSHTVAVNDHTGATYSVTTAIAITSGSNASDVRISLQSGMAGVFNIFDVYVTASEFVADMSQGAVALPPLDAYWSKGEAIGTYTCFQADSSGCDNGVGIYVLNTAGDTDEFDDDVLWHEFGHFVELSLEEFDSPGGFHRVTDYDLDLRLSWSEGHGNYLQSAIKSWLKANNPGRLSTPSVLPASYYVDTFSTSAFSIDFAALGSEAYYSYSTNESAVANTLWDMKERLGIQSVWDVLAGHLSFNTTADTLEAFWDGLLQQEMPGGVERTQWETIFAERRIHYQSDAYEADGSRLDAAARDCSVTAATILPYTCVDEEHYLYAGVEVRDTDFYALDLTGGVTYRLGTYNMRNGADTLIRLYDGDGVLLTNPTTGDTLVNDDYIDCGLCDPLHDGTNFRSQLSYTPPVDARVFLEVLPTDYVYENVTLYGYIGRYGTYTLRINAVE